ncbi:uncharacterized protein BX664DRAFT_344248, partial [Halteromyces radiatus]|uniref:uncharacterized protein n=1 Tax=Halteromyces radiatus TaxID=101107 RepID=UPI002220C80C
QMQVNLYVQVLLKVFFFLPTWLVIFSSGMVSLSLAVLCNVCVVSSSLFLLGWSLPFRFLRLSLVVMVFSSRILYYVYLFDYLNYPAMMFCVCTYCYYLLL